MPKIEGPILTGVDSLIDFVATLKENEGLGRIGINPDSDRSVFYDFGFWHDRDVEHDMLVYLKSADEVVLYGPENKREVIFRKPVRRR